MSDTADPRQYEVAAELAYPLPVQGHHETRAKLLLMRADAVDPLRMLLADEGRMLKLIESSLLGADDNARFSADNRGARAVLAALREVFQ